MSEVARKPKKRVNLRTPDVMERVQAEVESHYRSALVERIRGAGGVMQIGQTTIRLAKQFGFCYGVERAIDLAYAARRVFPDRRIFLYGEIIHNPDVNYQIREMGIHDFVRESGKPDYSLLTPDDVVIIPAFGAETHVMERVKQIGCDVVDTTCGDVMSVWRRVRQNASEAVTSIIHGKKTHEETKATASRALGKEGSGHYLIVLDLAETERVCDFMVNGGDPEEFLREFEGATSDGFDPMQHLRKVGIANQTTMLRSETEAIQSRIRAAVVERDGTSENFRFFDTICGATQERQDALFEMLQRSMDLMLVVGGYNSSNTTHLVEIAEKRLPTFFIRNAQCLLNPEHLLYFDIHRKQEGEATGWLPQGPATIGITAGASCPNNLIEATIRRVLEFRGEEV